jgi:AraC-like DNA-binding protein
MSSFELHIESDTNRQASCQVFPPRPHLRLVRNACIPILAPNGSCFGAVTHRRKFDGIVLAQTYYNATTEVPYHRHECPGFFFLLRGLIEILTTSGRISLRSGQAAFHSSADTHCFRLHSRFARGLYLEIGGAAADAFRGLSAAVVGKASRIPAFLAQLYQELVRHDGNSPLAVRGLVFQMAASLSREQRPAPVTRPRWLTDIEKFLDANLSTPIDMEQLVRIAGVEARQIRKAFCRFLRCTPAEYLRAKRIESAREQLIATHQPIAEVAAEAGFYDQAHFCHQFRKITGLSPREFRALIGVRPPCARPTQTQAID